MSRLFASILILIFASASFAAEGITIHSAEFGVGKFHRYDNTVHAYAPENIWSNFIVPANAPTDKPYTMKNADGSFTIFYSTLDEMLETATQISQQEGKKISVLNIHGHGLPGGMWFPTTAQDLNGMGCASWRQAASGSDKANYDQYYSPISAMEIYEIRLTSNSPPPSGQCITGLKGWQSSVASHPAFKAALASDLQVHFASCVVGLGNAGDQFVKGIAALLLPAKGTGHVVASMNFGLGDWSMPEGMGFWDMQNSTQLNHDNDIYPVDRQDREIMQKGTVRVAEAAASIQSTTVGNQDFMNLNFAAITGPNVPEGTRAIGPMPTRVRIPGTAVYVNLQ